MPRTQTTGIFRLPEPAEGFLRNKVVAAAARPSLARLLCLPRLNSMYADLAHGDGRDFLKDVLDLLQVKVNVDASDLKRIPKSGPVVVTANHPFGGLEGIVLAMVLRSVRPDVKLMANHLLAMIPEMREHVIAVDPFGGPNSTRNNIRALKECILWLRKGGLLGIFPAGEVSSLNLKKRAILDPEWKPFTGRLIRAAKAAALPVYFKGANGPLFHLMGLVHPRVRTVLLPRELLNKQRRSVDLCIGSPIAHEKLISLQSDEQRTQYLRLRSYILKHRGPAGAAAEPSGVRGTPIPVSDGKKSPALEIESLGQEAVLLQNNEYLVFSAKGEAIPATLREIGRLREQSFREVGEGTGKDIDLDRFDNHYEHLVLWNRKEREIAGAYRMGRVDSILETQGRKGLYTATLFKFKNSFFKKVNPSLELGRAFVRKKYRKSYSPPLLLWKGIGRFVAQNPRYGLLFGPVSISDNYHPLSKLLMMRFLKSKHTAADDLVKTIKPRTPPRLRSKPPGGLKFKTVNELCNDIEGVSGVVSEIEGDGKGVPVLLRQYLKLGGVILTFNVDNGFGNALDGLMAVDLTKTPVSMLARYMGPDQAQSFLAHKRDRVRP